MTNRLLSRAARTALFAAACACASVCASGLLQSERVAAQSAEQLRVYPAEAIVAPGAMIHFTVEIDGAASAEPVVWRVIPGTLGSIAPDGAFIGAERAGRGIVRAEVRAGGAVRVGHALVRVSDAPGAARLRVTPASATLAPGEALVFRAEPQTGGAIETPVEWSVAPEGAGTIASDGQFVAGSGAGRVRVLARSRYGGAVVEGVARVWIGAALGAPPSLAITPPVLTLRPGERSRLDARIAPPGADSLRARIRWSVFPPTLGWLAPDGTFEAGASPGEGHAAASIEWDGEAVRAFARIRVFPEGGAAALRVRPASALLVAGRPVRFEAFLLAGGGAGGGADRGGLAAGDAGGNRGSGAGTERERINAEWSVEPPNLGTMTSDGVLTPAGGPGADGAEWIGGAGGAPSPGAGTASGFVVARTVVGGAALEARAAVRLAPGAVSDLLDLRPRFITTRPGGETRVDAFLGGRPLPAIIPVRWSVAPPTLGTVTPDGLFTANANLATPSSDEFGRREGVLVATATLPEGKLASGTARVVVAADAAPPGAVRVIPAHATLGVTETVRFRVAAAGAATGTETVGGGAGAEAALAEGRIVWRVIPERLGMISPDGLFTPNPRLAILAGSDAARRPDGRVIAEVRVSPNDVVRGEARVTIVLPPVGGTQMSIEPPSADLTAASTLLFAAKIDGTDATGLPMAAWTVMPRALGSITAAGLFKPNPEPPLLGEPVRRGVVRFAASVGTRRLEATADVTVRY